MKFQHFESNLIKENEYPKLVRDKTLEIFKQKTGRDVKSRVLVDDLEYLKFLLQKIEEEVYELVHAEGREHQAREVADVLELFDSLLDLNGLTWEQVMQIKKKKMDEKGGFKKRILMLEKN